MAARLKLTFDLVEVIKSVTSDRRKLRVYLPLVSDQGFKREFGKRCIDDIESRLDDGVDKNGKAMKKYSEAYKQSEVFKFWGKDNTVNLKLTGQMRSAIDVVSIKPRTVTIGFIDQEANDKAHGHVHGSNFLPVRDFWGVPKSSQVSIMKEMISEFSGRETVEVDLPGATADVGTQQGIDLTDEDGQ